MIRRTVAWLAGAFVVVGAAIAGYWLLFTTFKLYDDEGYVLISLRNFSQFGGLYDQVYSQYGPFPYLLYDGLHRLLGFDFTNTSGRWITLFTWTGTSVICGLLVARFTRSVIWALFTFSGVFTYLWIMVNEPSHPGGLIALLVALGAWLGAEAWRSGNLRRFGVLAGVIGALLALTKINVGVFYLGSAAVWLAVNSRNPRVAQGFGWLVAVGAAAAPLILMRALWGQTWVHVYALIFATGLIATLLVARRSARPAIGISEWGWLAGSAAAVGLLIVGLTLIRGTSLSGLLHGVLLDPMQHPGVYYFAMDWRRGSAVLAIILLGLALLAERKGWLAQPWFRQGVAGVRLIIGALLLAFPLQLITSSQAAWGMSYGISLAWLMVVPLREDGETAPLRGWLALILILQFLHAYPVAGSQVNWGTFLVIPLAALGLYDAIPIYRSWLGTRLALLRPVGAGLVLATSLLTIQQLWGIGHGNYYSDLPRLGLPGAENLRQPRDLTSVLQVMDENLRAHSNTVFSLPGIYSLNLWTGQPTPTLRNATHWFTLLHDDQQEEIIRALDADPRSAVVLQRDVIAYLADWGFGIDCPLARWIAANYTSVLAIDGYDLRLRTGRTIAPLSTARLELEEDSARLTLTLSAPDQPIRGIRLEEMFEPRDMLLQLDTDNATFSTWTVELDGEAIGPAVTGLPEAPLEGIVRIEAEFPRSLLPIAARNTTLIVPFNSDEERLAELRLAD